MHRGGRPLLWILATLQLAAGPAAAAQPVSSPLPGRPPPARRALPAPPAGRVAGSDKLLHALAGASCALLASAAAAPVLRDGPQSDLGYALCVAGAGLGAAVAAGAAKELLDLTGFGDPDWADLLATAAGGLAVSAAVLAASSSDREARLAPVYACFGVALALPPAAGLLNPRPSRRASRSGS